jgi:threonine/homoserine/homoserine lactone efflux protein
MISYLLQGLGLGLAAAAQPGPFQAYLVGEALEKGWRRTLPAGLAPLLSDGPIVALVLLALHRVPAPLVHGLYVVGGIFVLYLATQAFAAWRTFNPGSPAERRQTGSSIWRAALMNALSPGPYIYWSLVSGPIFLTAWREAHTSGLGFLAGFYTAMVGTSAAIIVLAALARELGSRVNRVLVGISALALLALGLRQVWIGLSGWCT